MVYLILSRLLIIFGIMFVVLAIISAKHKNNRLANLFALMCLAMAVYISSYGLELGSSKIENIKFFLKLEYLGFSFVPVFWFLIAYRFYFKRDNSFSFILLLSIVPLLTMFITATNDYHHLYYKSIKAITINGHVFADLEKGIWYVIFNIFTYILAFVGLTLYYKAIKRAVGNYKSQSKWMFLGTIPPMFVNLLYTFKLTPTGFDPMPFGLSLTCIIYFMVIFKYQFLDLKELIRNSTFEQVKEGIIVIDDKNRLLDFNKSVMEIFSYLTNESIGKSFANCQNSIEILIHENNENHSKRNIEINNKYYEWSTSNLVENEQIVGRVFIFQDITEQKILIDELLFMATHDFLCEIFNRRELMLQGEKILNSIKLSGNNMGIMMIDLDYFKKINDTYGHLAGDTVLQLVSYECQELLDSQSIIGRYGGEEFVIITQNTSKAEFSLLAENIRKKIENLVIPFNGKLLKVTISIGYTLSKENETKILSELIDRADTGLYLAKDTGRNRVCEG